MTTSLLSRLPRQADARRSGPAFYTGTHCACWLWDGTIDYPLFVSHRRLARYKTLKPATVPAWAIDSGGFTELSTYGEWRTTPREYVQAVADYVAKVGRVRWAAPQDHMCEPAVIYGGVVGGKRFPGTGLSVPVHQHLTVLNYVTLINLWPEYSDAPCPFVPVLQGWTLGDYLYCKELYRAAGVDLQAAPVVGLGSVCRRQSAISIGNLVHWLASDGLKLHGFGIKTEGLSSYGECLVSSDSMAWSTDARHQPALPGHMHRNCANCRDFATLSRRRLVGDVGKAGLAVAA